MVGLNNKEAFGDLNYFVEMQFGTYNKTAHKKVQNINVNKPLGMKLNYESGAIKGSYEPAATQLMTISTQDFGTRIALDSCDLN